jgi:uncharacterized protein (DUF1330 family)
MLVTHTLRRVELAEKVGGLLWSGKSIREAKAEMHLTSEEIWNAVKDNGFPFPGQGRFTLQEQIAICRDYEAGLNRTALKTKYGTTMTTLNNILEAHGAEFVATTQTNYSLEAAVTNTGLFSVNYPTHLYLTKLVGHEKYVKVGVARDLSARWKRASGVYGQPIVVDQYASAHPAFFLEQALLEATLAYKICPTDLEYSFPGWTEIRRIATEDILSLYDTMHRRLLKFGVWTFAANYVWMPSHLRTMCEQNNALCR